MQTDLKKKTEQILKDLHARESMRLGWYRQWSLHQQRMKHLRERKASHQAFLNELMRKRGLSPAWYARLFYLSGHLFGWLTAFLPDKMVQKIETTLEFWILERYKKYFDDLHLSQNLRSMIESMQLRKLSHNEPGTDVLTLLQAIIQDEESLISS
jgi:demethoxyubiquinone hydroxylase (CLK1/Coq7/Cat5 family)